MKKHEIAVFIENEEMLREARELLEKYGEEIDSDDTGFTLTDSIENYLRLMFVGWTLNLLDDLTLITIPQLEEILKNQ
jgi:hypothetical protein